ncbi:MAG: ABC transporter permease [Thermoanaerobaculia bacterium]
MNGFLQDLRYAVRTLRKSPGYAAVALATLALGIGANTAIFSVLDTVLLRPLPYAGGERLVMVGDRVSPGGSGSPNNVGFATYVELRDRNRTFDAMAAVRSWQPTLLSDGVAELLPAMRVSANYFSMLGARPALGRDFRPEDDRPDTRRVLILSDGLWRGSFGADPSIVGRVIRLDSGSFRVVGVMPPDFEPLVSTRYYKPARLWAPIGYDLSLPQACHSCQHLKALGRLAPGVTSAQARADLDGVRRRLALAHPQDYAEGSMDVVPLSAEVTSGLRTPLIVLVGAVGFVLLIACANVANLTLARSLRRGPELALRSALGASRGRLVRQLFAESLVLCVAGGALGFLLAGALQSALLRLAPVSLPRADRIAIDARVLGFAALASFMAAVLSGGLPALRASAAQLSASLASASRGSAAAGVSRARRVLTVAELALAVVLVAGAFLMVRSMARLLDTPYGFSTDRVLTLGLASPAEADTDSAIAAYQVRLLEQVHALPGVEAAALVSQIPLGGNGDYYGFHVEGRMASNPADDPSVERYSVTLEYFRAMGIPIRRGRPFTAEDRIDSPAVMIVSEATAKSLFPGRDPIGERVRIGAHDEGPWRTIVGVAGDVRHVDVALAPTPQMYLPQTQMTDGMLTLVVLARTESPARLTESIRSAMRALDAGVPVYDVASMSERVARSAAPRRFVMQLLGAFALAALALAALGLYGVVAHSVGQRTREIGIRMALGATPRDIARLVLVGGSGLIAAGLAAGLLGALGASRFLSAILYEVRPGDPVSLAAAAAVLAAAAFAAHWLPARRAARLDPMTALRTE